MSPSRRTAVWATLAAVAIVATLVGYWLAGEKSDDIVLFIGGPVVGYLAGGLRDAWRRDRDERTRRDATRRVEDFEQASRDRSRTTVGRLAIDDVAIVAASNERRTFLDRVRFTFAAQLEPSRPDPDEWEFLEAHHVPALIERANAEGRPFQNGPKVDLVGVEVSRALTNRTVSPTVYTLRIAPTDYFRFAAMSNSLDTELDIGGERTTLRDRWRDAVPREIRDTTLLPAPACIGTVTVVVSLPDQAIVCHDRAALFQAGATSAHRRNIHFVGEGMLPDDRLPNGEPSPLVTARRGLFGELALVERHDADVNIVPTGVFLDIERWQPVFSFVALVDATFDEIASTASTAKDFFETRELLPRACSSADPRTRDLLLGQDGRLALASNHASTALLLALVYWDGLDTVRRNLA